MCIALAALVACDNYSAAYDRLGITAHDDGISIQYLSCPDEVVEHARLYELNGNQTAPDDDLLIWEYAAPDATQTLKVGLVPSIDNEPITLDPRKHYWVDVETKDSLVGSFDFQLGDIDGGLVRSNDRTIDPAKFVRSARESC
jgi:hypothetical protein